MDIRDAVEMCEKAADYIIGHYGIETCLELHLILDNTPANLFLETLAEKLSGLAPEEFVGSGDLDSSGV